MSFTALQIHVASLPEELRPLVHQEIAAIESLHQRRLWARFSSALSTSRCACCGKEIPVPQPTAEAIHGCMVQVRPDQSPCLDLPAAFTDPRLLASCPHCSRPLKFNPFSVKCGCLYVRCTGRATVLARLRKLRHCLFQLENHVSRMTPLAPTSAKIGVNRTPVKHKRTWCSQFIGRGIVLVERCAQNFAVTY